MFSRVRDFLNRHRRKFIVSGILVTSFVLVLRYTQRKIREWQEKEVRDLLERAKRQQHFESTERTCDQTILTLATTLRKSVTREIDTEKIVEQLKGGSTEKVSAWNNLKVLAIARSTVVVYSQAMLVATLRIQLNLVGGYVFKDSQNSGAPALATETIRQKYLSLCGYFMDEGVRELSDFIKEKAKQVTASISLKDKLTLRDMEQIYWSIVSSIMIDSRDPVKNLSFYMLPPDSREEENETLRKMIKETSDLLNSEQVQHLIRNTIASGFHVIIDHIAEYFVQVSGGRETAKNWTPLPGPSSAKETAWVNSVEKPVDNCHMDGFMNLNKTEMAMAKLIPILNGQVPANPNAGDVPSDWLQRLIFNEKYKALGVNVYETFSR